MSPQHGGNYMQVRLFVWMVIGLILAGCDSGGPKSDESSIEVAEKPLERVTSSGQVSGSVGEQGALTFFAEDLFEFFPVGEGE